MTHHIAVTIDDGRVEGKITCDAPVGAQCRLTCPDGCESWDWDDHEHTFVDGGGCGLLGFADNDWADIWELYEGDPGPLRSGAVDLTYSDEQVTWAYTPTTDPAFWEQLELPGLGLPVPGNPGVVAKFRYPIPASESMRIVKLTERLYGPDLVILFNEPDSHGWMVIARPEVTIETKEQG